MMENRKFFFNAIVLNRRANIFNERKYFSVISLLLRLRAVQQAAGGAQQKAGAAGGGRRRQEAARWPGVMSAGVTTESYTQDAAAVLQRLETRTSNFYTHLTDHVLMEFINQTTKVIICLELNLTHTIKSLIIFIKHIKSTTFSSRVIICKNRCVEA